MLLSKCAVHNSKKWRFIKEQEVSGLLTRSLLNYVPYVLSCLRVSCSMCPRALRAPCPTCLVPHVLSCPTFLVPYVPRASCPTCSCALRASCPMCSRALHASYSTCLVPYVLMCFTCLVLHLPCASRFMSPFSLCSLLFCTLRTLCSNITFCALEFPWITLLFCCYLVLVIFFFGGGGGVGVGVTKTKTNIVCQ